MPLKTRYRVCGN